MAFGCFNSTLIQILRGNKQSPLLQAGVLVRMNLAGRPLLLYAQLETHYRFNPGYLGSDHCSPEPGTGSNALALCYRRYASRHSAVYHRCRRVRPWSPSHIVAKCKAEANPLRRSAREFSWKNTPRSRELSLNVRYGSGAIPLKCMFLSGKWFSRLYAAKTADQSSRAVTIFSVRSLRLN